MSAVTEIKIENEHVFEDVDTSGVAPELIRYLEEVAALPEVRAVHDRTGAILAAQPGERVLEVGCGLGADARELAAQVAPGGEVVGVDLSQAMVDAAIERHDGSAVTYRRANVTDLPFEDAEFDVVRIERVLQHVADVDRACAEMARVLKPGGRVLAYDTDWGSFAIAPETPLVRRCLDHLATRFVQRRVALDLRRHLGAAGLTVTDVSAYAFVYTDFAQAAVPLPMLNERVPADAVFVPREERDAWFAELKQADADGTFVVGWTGYSALARKPG